MNSTQAMRLSVSFSAWSREEQESIGWYTRRAPVFDDPTTDTRKVEDFALGGGRELDFVAGRLHDGNAV